MKRTRLTIGAAVAAIAATAALLGGVFREGGASAPAAVVSGTGFEDFRAGLARNASTAGLVLSLQSTLEANPKDERSWVLLGLAYQQRARETGDSSYYPKSEGALRRALALEPRDHLVYSGLGSLALSRHRFAEALQLGRKALRLSPSTARNHGIVGDALVELGRYREAFNAFDEMNRLRPSLSSYARASYGRELIGHTDAAVEAMKLAVDAATGTAEPAAWAHVQLAKLYFNHGQLRQAERELQLANATFPNYPYGLDALAQVLAAKGSLTAAISLAKRAVDLNPLPQYVAQLGDLYTVAGRPKLARRQYALIGAIGRLLQANGVRTDLELALFDVDHGVRLPQALERARAAHRERPSIEADDVLAWALARNGKCGEALGYSKRALRLGTQDALKFFHRGMIERCLGREAPARAWFRRALDLNPNFSLLWSPVARRYAS